MIRSPHRKAYETALHSSIVPSEEPATQPEVADLHHHSPACRQKLFLLCAAYCHPGVLYNTAVASCRGAGPLVRVQGHSRTVLKLLQQPGISDSQDTSIKAAATAVMQQLLRPGVVQQLLADDGDAYQQQQLQQSTATDGSTAIGVHSSDISCSSMRASNELLMGCVHVLLQLAACGTSVLGSTAAAGSNEAAVQAQAIEQLLEQLAAAAGYCGVDQLLGLCRQQLLNQVWVVCNTLPVSTCHTSLISLDVPGLAGS